MTRAARWCGGSIAALGFVLAPLAPARAASLDGLRARGDALAAELRTARQSGGPGFEAELALVGRLGPLVLEFIAESDRIARTGVSVRGHRGLVAAFAALAGPLDSLYSVRAGRLEAMARQVMDEDGDLEALYETRDWVESQRVATEALYYRNWLNYYGARLFEGGRQKELLEAAERGFSEFAVGEHKGELATESLLGRGLCHLELGNDEWAIRDFRLVLDESDASLERKAKARLALLDAYARAGKTRDSLRYSKELLASGNLPASDLALVRFQRLEVLFTAIDGASGKTADAYRAEAGTLMRELRAAGKGWADRVDALMLERVDDPARWAGRVEGRAGKWNLARLMLQKEDYENARPLLEQVVADANGADDPVVTEANYWLGVTLFKAGDYRAAADRLDSALAAPNTSFAAEAAYLRFKALETLLAEDEASVAQERYRASLEEFLTAHADHPLAYEARYRRGESEQARGDFAAALEEYALVAGDPIFAMRAGFGGLQCLFEMFRAERDPSAREALLARIGPAIEQFWQRSTAAGAAGKESPSLDALRAKATLLQAVYLSLGGADGAEETAALLADFAERYPGEPERIAEASRLRLAALGESGQFAAAEDELKKHGVALGAEARSEALEKLAADLARKGARLEAEGDAERAAAARRVALGLYRIVDDPNGTPDLGRRLTVARLEESTGDLASASATYEAILAAAPASTTALTGLAGIAEARGDGEAALGYWSRYAAHARPGDTAWYRGRYEQARLRFAGGDETAACQLLEEVRPAIAGLRDADLRKNVVDLYARCD